MSFRSQVALDARANINALGDAVTLTTPNGTTSYALSGQVRRVDTLVDPLTGEKLLAPRTEITLALADLPSGGITEAWRVSTTDVEGTAIAGNIQSIRYDRTIGYITLVIEAVN